jgi:hypothetical protein
MKFDRLVGMGSALLIALASHGCATQKVLLRSDLEMIRQLTVTRESTPEILKYSGGGTGAGVLLGGVLGLGGIGLAMQAIAHSEGKEMRERLGLPDFGELVMKKFVERVVEQIPNWPKMIVEETPIDEAPQRDRGYLLTFSVGLITVRSYGDLGLSTSSSGQIVAPDGKVLWKKTFVYSQSQAGRAKELAELEADGGKLLKEEMNLGAETTVQGFIDNIRGNITP